MNNPEEAVLENPNFWRLFLPKLSCGTDPDHDAKMIHSFCEATKIPQRAVISRMWTFYLPGSPSYH